MYLANSISERYLIRNRTSSPDIDSPIIVWRLWLAFNCTYNERTPHTPNDWDGITQHTHKHTLFADADVRSAILIVFIVYLMLRMEGHVFLWFTDGRRTTTEIDPRKRNATNTTLRRRHTTRRTIVNFIARKWNKTERLYRYIYTLGVCACLLQIHWMCVVVSAVRHGTTPKTHVARGGARKVRGHWLNQTPTCLTPPPPEKPNNWHVRTSLWFCVWPANTCGRCCVALA